MYNAAIARKKTVNNGKRGLEKSWYWIKYFIKSEVRNCNYETSYNLGESVSDPPCAVGTTSPYLP